jgi:hypothetical protein
MRPNSSMPSSGGAPTFDQLVEQGQGRAVQCRTGKPGRRSDGERAPAIGVAGLDQVLQRRRTAGQIVFASQQGLAPGVRTGIAQHVMQALVMPGLELGAGHERQVHGIDRPGQSAVDV